MKILFFMRSTVYVRNFESTLRMLAERGHDVHVVADPHHLADSSDLIERLSREYPTIRHSRAPAIPFRADTFLGLELRRAIDYLRYLGPEFADAPKLRDRAERNAPPFVKSALERPLVGSRLGRRWLRRGLHWCDRAVPRDPAVDAFIRTQDPDLVLVTPLVEPGSPQAEYLRSARALGIRTGLCVYSWDNLTNKGLIHDPLDLVTVWNEPMKQEAISLHRVPADRVVVTGAVPYDHWFKWGPRASREAFCRTVGLRPDRPYLLYVCSSKFIAPNEAKFVDRWVQQLRAASTTLRDVGVLVRPHPQNAEQWETAALGDRENVSVWPRGGANPTNEMSRADYYDSIYHSAAVVGVNTSALIESAIVGRGVYTVLAPEFRDTQEGTLHFRHLHHGNGALLHLAESFGEHAAQLEMAVRGVHDDPDRCRRFVQAFLRPRGKDTAAVPLLVAALEATAARGPRRRDRGPWWGFMVRPALVRIAARVAHGENAHDEKTARRERIAYERKANLANRRADQRASKERVGAERALGKQREEARLEAERRAVEAIAARAYEHYLHVRDRMQRVRASSNGATVVLTDAERRTVAALAPLWDATPETIASLRRWCEPISDVRAADYDGEPTDLRQRLKRDVSFLRRQFGRELFVQEPLALGGFGCDLRGERCNEDTLKFFKAIAALHDGGVLGEYRRATRRRIVWEIGGGWGGFAYQFKTLCPHVTYLITGIPDVLLVSAVYLGSVFPGARCRLFDPSSPGDCWRGWEDVDFIFAPEDALPVLDPPRIDLTIDIMALRKMCESRVSGHVQRAFDLGSRYFYSLLPGACAGDDASSLWRTIDRLYWTQPVPPRIDAAASEDQETPPPDDYAHLVGWRRLRV